MKAIIRKGGELILRKVETRRKITQKITRNRVRTDDLTTGSHLETHRDPLSGLFDGEIVERAGRISRRALQIHLQAVKKRWPLEKWSENAPYMPLYPHLRR